MVKEGPNAPARHAGVAILLALAVGLSATPGLAAEGAFIVGPDQDAYRQSELTVLDAEARTALAEAASADPLTIDSSGNEEAISIFIRDEARSADVLARVRNYFVSRPDLVLSVSPVEVERISFPQQTLTSVGIDVRMPRALYLEEVVRDARDDPQGVDIRREHDGLTVRVRDPAHGSEIEAALRRCFAGGFLVTARPDHSWRVAMDPAFFDIPSTEAVDLKSRFGLRVPDAATRRIAPEVMEYGLRDELREPRNLRTIPSPEGLVILIADPSRYSAFRARLKESLSGNPQFNQSFSSGYLLTIRLNTARLEIAGDMVGAEIPAPLNKAWAQVTDLIDPPPPRIEIKRLANGLEIQSADPAQRANVAETIRRHFAGSPFVVDAQAGPALLIKFTDGYLASKVPEPSVLAGNVRTCMKSWNLAPSRVSVVGESRIEVVLARRDDADRFRHSVFTRCGFAMRMVHKNSGGDPAEPPPTLGDERFPQADEAPSLDPRDQSRPPRTPQDLWLRPGAFITADMLAQTRIGVDLDGLPVIRFRFTEEGRRRFAAMTAANVGQKIAIVFDGLIVSTPVIMAPITGDQGEVAGNFTAESAQALADAMAGSQPQFPLKIIDSPGDDHKRR